MMRAKTINEEDSMNIPKGFMSGGEFNQDDENNYLEDDFDEDDVDTDMSDFEEDDIAELSSQLEELFQSAASKGMPFEVVQDLAAQALDQVDWVDAGQM